MFEAMIENAGKLGVAAILIRRSDILMFIMQLRSCDIEAEEALKRYLLRDELPMKILLSKEGKLSYCPHCGMDLIQMLNNNKHADVASLIERHALYGRCL
ncbi:MAG: hypothetical protein QM811_23800 [Pirellulales bacterium]